MTEPKKSRLQIRFSLRTMLTIVVVVAVVSAFYGKRVLNAQRQRQAILELMSVGAHISYGVDESSWIQGSFWSEPPSASDNWYSILIGDDFFNSVSRVTFSDSRIVDGKFERYKEPEKTVVDDDLRHLVNLPNLRSLSLYQTAITDQGLSHLESLRELKYLILEGTQVTNAGVERLQKQIPGCKILR